MDCVFFLLFFFLFLLELIFCEGFDSLHHKTDKASGVVLSSSHLKKLDGSIQENCHFSSILSIFVELLDCTIVSNILSQGFVSKSVFESTNQHTTNYWQPRLWFRSDNQQEKWLLIWKQQWPFLETLAQTLTSWGVSLLRHSIRLEWFNLLKEEQGMTENFF